jgi:hypothetical protein
MYTKSRSYTSGGALNAAHLMDASCARSRSFRSTESTLPSRNMGSNCASTGRQPLRWATAHAARRHPRAATNLTSNASQLCCIQREHVQ